MKEYEKMKIFTCPMCCNAGFTNLADLKNHLVETSTAIKCPGCSISCKDVILLIKHLNECSASSHKTNSEIKTTHPETNDLSIDSHISDEEEDDVEGYFCTVCDIKIPDLYQHIQQFHNGQEVILQDDDEDEDNNECSKPSIHDTDTPRKRNNVFNGTDKTFKKKMKLEEDDESCNDTYYCSKCHVSFQSLAEHTTKYHEEDDVTLRDVPITELFPESKLRNGSFGYFCSCCQKTLIRRSTLPKHLKIRCSKDKTKTSEPTYEVEEVKLEPYEFVD